VQKRAFGLIVSFSHGLLPWKSQTYAEVTLNYLWKREPQFFISNAGLPIGLLVALKICFSEMGLPFGVNLCVGLRICQWELLKAAFCAPHHNGILCTFLSIAIFWPTVDQFALCFCSLLSCTLRILIVALSNGPLPWKSSNVCRGYSNGNLNFFILSNAGLLIGLLVALWRSVFLRLVFPSVSTCVDLHVCQWESSKAALCAPHHIGPLCTFLSINIF